MLKPRMRYISCLPGFIRPRPGWTCWGWGCRGTGPTPRAAYDEWAMTFRAAYALPPDVSQAVFDEMQRDLLAVYKDRP